MLDCKVRNKKYSISFTIIDENVRPILGLIDCYRLGLVKRIDSLEIGDKESFVNENRDVFKGLGKFESECKIILKENCIPVAKPARRVPLIIRDKLLYKLKDLERQKIIVKANEDSQWVNNLVIIEKPDGSIRLCMDPQDLNKCIK